MIVMDSGLGGLSVVRALRAARPGTPLTYLADTAGFPYGKRSAEDIAARAGALVETLTAGQHPGCVVLACNTLSTLCLETLRARFSFPFVGTVPAVKVAAQLPAKRFTLLATPNTADSIYSRNLIAEFAAGCAVDRYGAPNLAAMAERIMLGETPDIAALSAELAPAFFDDAGGKTAAVVLGCTHYPLIVDALRRAAPWDVAWIDSSDAIARRALNVTDREAPSSRAFITGTAHRAAYAELFAREGFSETLFLEAERIDGAA